MFVKVLKINHQNLTKQAYVSPDTELAKEAQSIMDTIYNENPNWWPYGLNVQCHDDVYIVKDKLTEKSAGFVGWQTRTQNGKRIGSYSIGILPEFRGNGFAKEAVAKIVKEKAKEVDEVKSYVKKENTKSKALAKSLNIPVIEEF